MYYIKLISEIQSEWFNDEKVVQRSLGDCRQNNDNTKAVLRCTATPTFLAGDTALTVGQIKVIMQESEWRKPLDPSYQ